MTNSNEHQGFNVNNLIKECKNNLKLIQKDFFQVHSQISKILSTNGLKSEDKTTAFVDVQITPIKNRTSKSKFNEISKKIDKKSSKSIDFTKFQPDFASTPTHKLPKTSTPILEGNKSEKKTLNNCRRLVFANEYPHHHHCHCYKRHHHHHHHGHRSQKKDIKIKNYFIDLKNKRTNHFDLQTLNARNSYIIINKAKSVNNNTNYTKIKRKSIHQNQQLDLLANFKFYQ